MSADPPKPRAVFDCMVFLQGAARRDGAAGAVAYERDPRDEPYVNLAIAARAGFLVSRDGDFLDLANPSNADGALLRNLAPGLQILDPVSFLREVRRHSQTSP